jgi:hypothetical protein
MTLGNLTCWTFFELQKRYAMAYFLSYYDPVHKEQCKIRPNHWYLKTTKWPQMAERRDVISLAQGSTNLRITMTSWMWLRKIPWKLLCLNIHAYGNSLVMIADSRICLSCIFWARRLPKNHRQCVSLFLLTHELHLHSDVARWPYIKQNYTSDQRHMFFHWTLNGTRILSLGIPVVYVTMK